MHLNDQDMEIVAELGIIDKNTMILSLRDNKITSVGTSILAQSIKPKLGLKSLILDGNQILDAGVEFLAKAFANENIGFRTLYLNSTGVTDAGCNYLAEMIRINHWMIYLFLNDNKIGDDGVRVLGETIGSRNCGITMITLSGNKLLTDASVDVLCSAIKGNSNFHQLHLCNCSLSEAGQERLRMTAGQRTRFIIYL
jgi:Ran GTPase-activating protein (RanGAP) involved in mRNA processing and transport